jgi:hypothetical protein
MHRYRFAKKTFEVFGFGNCRQNGYNPLVRRRQCSAAIARLAGRDEVPVACSDKKLKRPQKTANSNANNNAPS